MFQLWIRSGFLKLLHLLLNVPPTFAKSERFRLNCLQQSLIVLPWIFLWHGQLPLSLRRLVFSEVALAVNIEEQDTSKKGLPASLPLTRLSFQPPFH